MSLTITKNITLNGQSTIDGTVAQEYRAQINASKPEDMTLTNWLQDKDVYKLNREQCRADGVEFEETAYALQEELIAELETADTTTEEE